MELYYYFHVYENRPTRIVTSGLPIDTEANPMYREMTQEQREFYLEHPDEGVWDVWNCYVPVPYVPTLDSIKENAVSVIQCLAEDVRNSRVDLNAFCTAVAGTVYSQSRGVDSIDTQAEILKTADDFLVVGKLCNDRMKTDIALIGDAETEEEVNSILDASTSYFESLREEGDTLEMHKRAKLREIDVYDTSENVNGFFYNGVLMWLDKDTRTGLVNTLNSAEIVGRDTVNIWFGGIYITLDIAVARQMLAALEIYATDCYNVTAQHKVSVNAMDSIADVDAFDVSVGYPQRLEFSTLGSGV